MPHVGCRRYRLLLLALGSFSLGHIDVPMLTWLAQSYHGLPLFMVSDLNRYDRLLRRTRVGRW